MTATKKLIAASAVGVISIATLSYAAVARADTSSDSLAGKIAQKFNVNEDEVQQVMEEHRKERHVEHEAELKSKIDQLAAEGKITSEQKELLINKFEEMKTERESAKEEFKNLTHDEKREKMESRKAEMDKWLEENDIDKSVVENLFGGQHGNGRGGMKGRHNN
jgi:hypothetical protein